MAKARVRPAAATEAVGDSPSAQIVKAANEAFDVTTKSGRVLRIQPLSGLRRLRFLKLLGAEGAKNEVYSAHCGMAVCVTAIDGDMVPFPTTERELEFLYQRLDDDGIEAVIDAFQQRFKVADPNRPADAVAEIKN